MTLKGVLRRTSETGILKLRAGDIVSVSFGCRNVRADILAREVSLRDFVDSLSLLGISSAILKSLVDCIVDNSGVGKIIKDIGNLRP